MPLPPLPSPARASRKKKPERRTGVRRGVLIRDLTYRGHSQVALEPPADAGVDTLGLPPAGVDTLEAVTLVASEALRAYIQSMSISQFSIPDPHS